VISEVRACALGARAILPRCRAILDIGVKDTKATCLTEGGELNKFEMNDKWAAGTGRLLESQLPLPADKPPRRKAPCAR
jgi:(R)-2-hydroxyacyl-CoA dehydratese activating ATPase